ncbi:hypothetical protein SISSUDRAFT_1021994 [Sistotremastrum suecicum HHB10207 ss-3]|uniref:Dipeptidase n=1 Tax=Sistotremastrum suecicum HHB10207 ss-3 TaxID=1314776 RepID=A0A166D1W0_9AGAM|nr:hypothetical protein SISSUDRAFT_1021994 [Sistotremastrum suecicum HHB10207 ss-3]
MGQFFSSRRSTNGSANERGPLLGSSSQAANPNRGDPPTQKQLEEHAKHERVRAGIGAAIVAIFILAVVLVSYFVSDGLPGDPLEAALVVLGRAPVIDGHIDLPILVRGIYSNNVSSFDLNYPMPGHVDIPRLREGRVGGFFWSAYVGCTDDRPDFLKPTNQVRDTLEQIDLARQIIAHYPETFQLVTNVDELQAAIRDGKIASLIGIEGAHQLGNSLGVLRTYKELGVKYLTLTHTCHNAFADSCGYLEWMPPRHGGLSHLGETLIKELNRLGILVDLSHTSDSTARQAIQLSEAPVIWSHSSARAVWNVPRNVPDDVLKLIGEKKGQKDGLIMVNFAPQFVAAEGFANVQRVADHIDHIANVTGKRHVGIGSDFDGIASVPRGLEDVSKYPQLFAELRSRGWSRFDLAGLAGTNLFRVMQGAEDVAREKQRDNVIPAWDIYRKRRDIGPGKSGDVVGDLTDEL